MRHCFSLRPTGPEQKVRHIRPLPFWKGGQFAPIGFGYKLSFPSCRVSPSTTVWRLTECVSQQHQIPYSIVSDQEINSIGKEVWKGAMTGFHGSYHPEAASLIVLEHPAEDRAEGSTLKVFSMRMWPPEKNMYTLNWSLQMTLWPQ